MLEPVCSGKLSVERVEAPVLLVDHNDVPEPVDCPLALLTLLVWRTSKRDTGGTGEYRRSRYSGSRAFHYIDE